MGAQVHFSGAGRLVRGALGMGEHLSRLPGEGLVARAVARCRRGERCGDFQRGFAASG